MRERNIEQYLVLGVKKRKGFCIKLLGLIGIPDRLVLLPMKFIVFIETKTARGKLSPLQKQWEKWLTNTGFPHQVIRSKVEVDEFLSNYDKDQK